MDNEQWKSDGICKYCRRQDYCSKGCKANNELHTTTMQKAFNDTLAKHGLLDLNSMIKNIGGNTYE